MNRLFALEQEVTRVRHRSQRSRQASIQLAIEKAYVTKTDKGGAYLHPITTNNAGNITAVKSIQVKDANRTRVPTGAELSVDTAKTGQKNNETYVWAQYKNKTGAIRESSIVVPPSGAVKAIVVKQHGAGLQRIADGPSSASFLPQSGVLETLPIGTRILVQPNVAEGEYVWTMHNGKVGALKRADFARIPPRLTFDAIWASPGLKQLFRAHLAKEFSAENLNFLEEVRDITTPEEADDVYDRFVPEKLHRPININSAERKRLKALRSRNNQLNKLEFGLNDTGQWANQPFTKQVAAPMGGGGGGGMNALLAASGNTRACVQIVRLLSSDSMTRFKTTYKFT